MRALFTFCALVIGGCMAVLTVRAEPYFAVQQGLKCMNCHANPTGGGLRNAFGNAWAQATLAERPVEIGDSWTGLVGRFVALGANVRADATYLDVPHRGSDTAFDLAQARLYLELSPVPERLSLYLDQRVAPGGSQNLEAYGRFWWGNRTWYVKGGQMYLPYGLRLEDDTAFIRQSPGINFTTPDQGIEVGLELPTWSAQLAVSNGTAAGPEIDDGKQWSARIEHVRSIWRLGASLNFNANDVGDRQMQNVFVGVRTGAVSWLAEVDYISDKGFAGGERKQWAGLLEANWLLRRGHNLKFTVEFFDPDDDVDEDEQTRYGALWEYAPIQFLQLRLGVRVYDGIPQNDLQNRRLAFVQLHTFF